MTARIHYIFINIDLPFMTQHSIDLKINRFFSILKCWRYSFESKLINHSNYIRSPNISKTVSEKVPEFLLLLVIKINIVFFQTTETLPVRNTIQPVTLRLL